MNLNKVFVVLSFPNKANDCQFCNYQICVVLTWLQAQKRSLKIIFCKSNDQRLLSSFCVFGQMIRSEESSNFGKVHWSRIHHLLFCLSFDQVLVLNYFLSVDLWETSRFQFDPWANRYKHYPECDEWAVICSSRLRNNTSLQQWLGPGVESPHIRSWAI